MGRMSRSNPTATVGALLILIGVPILLMSNAIPLTLAGLLVAWLGTVLLSRAAPCPTVRGGRK